MPVVQLFEYDFSKDEERRNKGRKFGSEVMFPYWKKMVEEKDIKVESSNWSDNTGHKVHWIRFETMEDYAKMWDDEKWQAMNARWANFADNVRIRLLRPGITIPEDLLQ